MSRDLVIPQQFAASILSAPARALARIFIRRYVGQLRQRNLRRRPRRPWARRRLDPPTSRPSMRNWCIVPQALPLPIPPCFKKNTSLLTSVRWGRRKTARHRRKTPFLDIRLDEDEAALTEVDVYGTRPVGADCGKEILRLEAVGDVLEFLAVAGEEDGPGAWAVADAYHVPLDVFGAVVSWSEGLIVAALACRCVG